MNYKEAVGELAQSSGRLWRFADYEFDELGRVLRVKGRAVDLESKPLDILLQLLLHAGEVVTKEELLDAVWPGVMVVDASLATAVSKLRKALGDEDHPVIVTVARVGYRLAVPVYCKTVAASAGPELGFKAGDFVPGRDQWRLTRPMDVSGSSEVWLAENPKTREQRVFKFAADGVRLKGLKREITVSRFLRESLGDRPEFVRILEWNFETSPFFLESEYAGPNLAEWAVAQGGLSQMALDVRLRLLIDIAQAVAAAHGIGVLHKDLKPANILVVPGVALSGIGGGWQIKIADFGSASLFDPSRLHALGITNLGFTQTVALDKESSGTPSGSAGSSAAALTGTLMYLPPEVLAGQSPSASADVYALGVILYQLLIGDFRKPLAPGWEAGIQDPLLREDIADAACGDPARRLGSAADLAERLLTLETRRVRRNELETAKQRAQVAEQKLAAARARRPWVALAVIALAIGLGFSITLYRRAAHERDIANRQTAIASSVSRFLSDDLLGRGNPFSSGKSSESLMEAIQQASPSIDRQFKDEPLVAARLHQTIARALDNRTDYPDARLEYDRAAHLFQQVDGDLSQDAIVVQLQRVTLEARAYQSGSLPLAKSILEQQKTLIAKLAHPRPDLPVWLASAQGMIALVENNAKSAAENFQIAVEKADVLPEFDESARLTFKQRLAFSYIRLGEGAKAEQLFRELIAAFTRVAGPDSPHVLRVRLNLAQALMIQNKHEEAVKEANAIYPEFVSRLGPDHELTMQLLTTRAQSEGSLGMWDDAIRDDLMIHDLAVKKQGSLSFFAAATLADASLAQCRAGRYREGEANARQSYAASAKAFGPRAGLTGGAAYSLATCLIGQNKLDEAAALLPQIDAQAVAQLSGDPDWGAGIKLSQAEIAYRRHDYDAARIDLQSAAPVFTRKDAEPYQKHAFESLKAALDKLLPRN
ncbi:MAG TPA: tetratricopeptide repeat protein [Terriglobales bacterium]|jgi:DNA-binding winged helix-turn-helix (wHTH) protein/serine/threonine protein kinase|nr:tetratricopeptide repeat protein [Terriglobales bacterium]